VPGPGDGDGVDPGAGAVVLRAGAPGRLLAVISPLAAIALVSFRFATEGLADGDGDPVPPAVLAVVTVGVGVVLGWRAATQRATFDPVGVRCRNLVVGFSVDWDLIEEVVVHRRGGLQVLDLRFGHLRRRLRVGAATRFVGAEAASVLEHLGRLPSAADRLQVDEREP